LPFERDDPIFLITPSFEATTGEPLAAKMSIPVRPAESWMSWVAALLFLERAACCCSSGSSA
jgi:hypothetical protein